MLVLDNRLAVIDKAHWFFKKGNKRVYITKYNVIAFLSLAHDDDYYEVIIPEFNYESCFMSKERIVKFID